MRRPIASLAAIVGPNSGDLVTEAVLAIEMGADAHDIGLTIHPHRTLSETIAMAAEMVEGCITELIPPKTKAKRTLRKCPSGLLSKPVCKIFSESDFRGLLITSSSVDVSARISGRRCSLRSNNLLI